MELLGNRKTDLLHKVFRQYLVPMIILTVASSLSEFVDSIVVSALLGNEAMAVVNMGMPLSLIFMTGALLVGVGGSSFFAKKLGEFEQDSAQRSFSVAMVVLLIFGLVAMVAGITLSDQLAQIMTTDETTHHVLQTYLRVLSFSALPYIFVNSVSYYLTAAGEPKRASSLIIVANVFNIIMDFIFIRVFGMGVEGAAFATMTGNLIGLALMIFYMKSGKTTLKLVVFRVRDISLLLPMCAIGLTTAVGQFGFACKLYSMNLFADVFGGVDGVIVFSLCFQTLSMVSVILAGIASCIVPIVSTLFGERDNQGIRIILNYAMKYVILFVLAMVAVFELFPGLLTMMYNVNEPRLVALAFRGVRIFVLAFIVRAPCIMLMQYYALTGHKRVAFVSGIIDSFAVIPIAFILCKLIGIDGIWMAFPCAALVQGLFTLLASRKQGVYMLAKEEDEHSIMSLTIRPTIEDSVGLSREIMRDTRVRKYGKQIANSISLLTEEMTAYTVENSDKDVSCIDVLLRFEDERVTLFFRSDGKPLSALNGLNESTVPSATNEPNAVDDKGARAGSTEINREMVLKLFAESVEYERILGLNSTMIVLNSMH